RSPTVRGFELPGLADPILVRLFADDTLIFLSAADRHADVQLILDLWCAVSGAKFNTDKTEIIPIGRAAHRANVLTTRKLHPTDRAISPRVHIADEGESVRYLGGWIGNHIDDASPWNKVVTAINASLRHWSKGHPTLFAKKHIVQMVVAGQSQYLAKVQGMPSIVEDTLIKAIRSFIWDDAVHPPLALSHLYPSRERGGIGLLDLQSRNEAIHLIGLKSFLDLSPSRPTWAFITDLLISKLAPATIPDSAKVNYFLQTWTVPLQGPRAPDLPLDVRLMLKAARTFDVSLNAVRLSANLQAQLPAW
ncbi:hypothetical protein FA95DRAFT_1460793, partial [Auriscalpium vulgare]